MSLRLASVDCEDIRVLAEGIMILIRTGDIARARGRAKEIERLAKQLSERLEAPEGRGK